MFCIFLANDAGGHLLAAKLAAVAFWPGNIR
jgi:hypothetical protein